MLQKDVFLLKVVVKWEKSPLLVTSLDPSGLGIVANFSCFGYQMADV